MVRRTVYGYGFLPQDPGSSPICLSGKTPKFGPQIPYNLRLKSSIPDKAAIHVTCDVRDLPKKA